MDKLFLKVVEARGLPRGDIMSKSDPYCVIRIKGSTQVFKTQVIQVISNPSTVSLSL
jgi:Ca2+-dependent lipid-binding protein